MYTMHNPFLSNLFTSWMPLHLWLSMSTWVPLPWVCTSRFIYWKHTWEVLSVTARHFPCGVQRRLVKKHQQQTASSTQHSLTYFFIYLQHYKSNILIMANRIFAFLSKVTFMDIHLNCAPGKQLIMLMFTLTFLNYPIIHYGIQCSHSFLDSIIIWWYQMYANWMIWP